MLVIGGDIGRVGGHWARDIETLDAVGRVNRTFCFTGAITGRSCSKAD